MATARILTLIERRDAREIIRDEIAAILVVESANQRALAVGGGKDPAPWTLRVFTERAAPWEALGDDSPAPIVNVWVETSASNQGQSVESRTTYTSTYHLDCYGFGASCETVAGHDPADETAARAAETAKTLVTAIIGAGQYVTLGFPTGKHLPVGEKPVVLTRRLVTVQSFQPSVEGRPVERVFGIRVDVEVDHVEYYPQFQPLPFDLLQVSLSRSEGGEWVSFEREN